MQSRILTGERLAAVFLCGCVLFNYPLLSLFDRSVDGVPLIFVYVFAAWAALIAVMAWVSEGCERREGRERSDSLRD